MYRIDRAKKINQAAQWTLPDRIFFACGACQILAHTFLQANEGSGYQSYWIKPNNGFSGNHIYVSNGHDVFDYHGFSKESEFLKHTFNKARRWWPGWNADIVPLPEDVLISEEKSKTYDGLWLRQPDQFFKDPVPRAQSFIKRFTAI